MAASRTTAVGVALAVDDDQGAGAGVVGTAQRLGERGVGLDGDGAPGEGAGLEVGEALAQPGHAQAVARAGPDDGGEDRGEQGVGEGVGAADLGAGVAEGPGVGEQRQADEDGDGERAADPGGGDGAGHGPAGDLPDDGAQHPAAVQRQAGQQVEDGDDEVGDHQAGEQDAGDRAGLDQLHADVEDPGEDEGEQRADEGEDEFPAGGLGLLLDLRDAAEELQLDAAYGQLEAQGGDGVGQLVDEHRGVEGDGEEEGDEVAGGAELGQHPLQLAAEDPGDEGGDEEPAGGDVDGHAEGAAHQDAAAGPPLARRRVARARCPARAARAAGAARTPRGPAASRSRPRRPLIEYGLRPCSA